MDRLMKVFQIVLWVWLFSLIGLDCAIMFRISDHYKRLGAVIDQQMAQDQAIHDMKNK